MKDKKSDLLKVTDFKHEGISIRNNIYKKEQNIQHKINKIAKEDKTPKGC